MLKQDLRKLYIEKRKQLSLAQVEEMSAQIAVYFSKFAFEKVEALLSYSPISDHNEFVPASCEALLAQRFPGMQLAWPRITDDAGGMEAVLVNEHTTFLKNRYNIHEPANGYILPPEKIDMIFVPLLGFDTRGYRLGYGKGYYDRYLARCRKDVLKIGFSFFEAVEAIKDINEFDVPLNLCITPVHVYEF